MALRERLKERTKSFVPRETPETKPEPPTDAKPPTMPKQHPKKTYPILHRNCGIYGDCEELEDHVRIDCYVRSDLLVQGGEVWAKTSWRKTFGKYPWETQDDVDPAAGISYEF